MKKGTITITCPECGHHNVFQQPYAYHAGFGNQGFLYNEAGNRTLIWSSFDPEYEAIVGNCHPWALTEDLRTKLQDCLPPDTGGKWLFGNPARCLACGHPISEPMTENIYYLVYDDSIDLDPTDHPDRGMKDVLKKGRTTPST